MRRRLRRGASRLTSHDGDLLTSPATGPGVCAGQVRASQLGLQHRRPIGSRLAISVPREVERVIFASMKIRRNVRAVLLDGDHLVFLRRGWPGRPSYYTTVGGGVEPDDADLEVALRREVMEEISATIGPVAEFLTVTEPGERVTVVQHYFRADVLDMDPDRRNGPEMDDPDIGNFSPVRVPLDVSALAALELQPIELADYLRDHVRTWGD